MSTLETQYWNMRDHVDSESLQQAAELLQQEEVVAFPTETVYGLGADATSEKAVQKIFEAKGRPADNPLIVHLANKDQIYDVVRHIPEQTHALIDRFLPGPLTLIFESNGRCAQNVTAGLSTVAVRIPDHPVASSILEACGLPLAAPSANLSGKPSPTRAEHVYKDLNGRIAGIIDGGPTGVGVESTVLDCTSDRPVILRPGGITKQDLEEVVGEVSIDPAIISQGGRPKSPGMKYTHYAPDVPLWLVEGDASFFQSQIDQLNQNGKRVGVIVSNEQASELNGAVIHSCGSKGNLREIAVQLYHALRSFDDEDVDVILCESFPEDGVGQAVMNRLKKAATQKISQT